MTENIFPFSSWFVIFESAYILVICIDELTTSLFSSTHPHSFVFGFCAMVEVHTLAMSHMITPFSLIMIAISICVDTMSITQIIHPPA
jgi:hypothetical protein